MKILITLLNYQSLTGSELYTYELARELKAAGHEVCIVSNCTMPNSELLKRTAALGIQVFDYKNFSPDMFVPDVLHVQQRDPATFAVTAYPETPAIATVHSEFVIETPLVDPAIKKYICVKPAAKAKIMERDGITEAMIEMIPIPVDFGRFNTQPLEKAPGDVSTERLVVSPMTIDWLRRNCVFDLIHRSLEEGFKLFFVGAKSEPYLDNWLPKNVDWAQSVWDIENLIKRSDMTAGVQIGKMTLESWACGKPSLTYTVDDSGNILKVEQLEPPADMSEYDSKNVAARVIKLYEEAINAAK